MLGNTVPSVTKVTAEASDSDLGKIGTHLPHGYTEPHIFEVSKKRTLGLAWPSSG